MSKPRSPETIGEFLREARIRAGMSQALVAAALGHSTSQYVSNYERGLCAPSNKTLVLFVNQFDVPKNKLKAIMLKSYIREVNSLFR